MKVHLPQNQEAQRIDLAARLLAHDEWFKQQVQIGIDQFNRGEFIEEDEMDARVVHMLQP